MAGLGDLFTNGSNSAALNAQNEALDQLQSIQTPTAQQLDLPALEQYAVAQNMTPAQMQAFLQQQNALANENVDQTGTSAEQAALAQLANTANQGAAGNATEQAQESQIQNQLGTTLAGQRGAIDQAAEARGVPLGLLQAALSQQNAGQDAQSANQAALTAQSNNYQTALNALANQGSLGGQLQGQQNTQANTVANAANAMQQFNAANQQAASANNAGFQQAANMQNTQNANQTAAANTGLANQRTQYNAQVPETVFGNQMQKAGGVAGQENQIANTNTQQGQQNAGLYSGLIGAGATLAGGPLAGMAANAALNGSGGTTGTQAVNSGAGSTPTGLNAQPSQYGITAVPMAHGGMIDTTDELCMTMGGAVPGKARVPGNSQINDTVHARLSPGEAVIPRTVVQQNPQMVHQLLAQSQQPAQGHNPQDVAALLQAMKHLRGAR